MSRAAEFLLSFLANAAWQAAAVALAASVCARLLRRAPARFRHALWVAALALCFALPAWSLFNFPGAEATRIGDGHALTARTREGVNSRQGVTSNTTQSPATDAAGSDDGAPRGLTLETLTRRRSQPVSGAATFVIALAALYALFVLWRVCLLWRAWRRVGRLRRSVYAREIPARLEAVAARCRAAFGLRGVSIKCSTEVRSPVVVGAREPVIILPESFYAEELPRETLTSVVGHEAAHVARRDFALNLVCEILYLPVSFHPLARLVRRQVDRTRELACDELVAERLLAPEVYARALVGVAGALASPPARALTPGVFDADILEERIMRLTHDKRRAGRRAARLLALASFAVLCLSCLAASTFSVEIRAGAASALDAAHAAASGEETAGASQQERRETPAPQERSVSQASQGEIAQGLGSSDPPTRARAACEAGHKRAVDLIPTLVSMLGDDAPVQAFRCWGEGRWSPALDSFKQPSPGEQAAIALASMGTPSVEPLTRALDATNAAARRNAAWAIGELTNMRGSERDGAVEPLINLLSDSDEWVRMATARALGEIRDERAAERLTALLSDDYWRVRELAAWALGEMKEEASVAALCNVLVSDSRPEVRTTAAWALGEIQSSKAVAALRQALDDPEQSVRDKARWALSEIEDSDG